MLLLHIEKGGGFHIRCDQPSLAFMFATDRSVRIYVEYHRARASLESDASDLLLHIHRFSFVTRHAHAIAGGAKGPRKYGWFTRLVKAMALVSGIA